MNLARTGILVGILFSSNANSANPPHILYSSNEIDESQNCSSYESVTSILDSDKSLEDKVNSVDSVLTEDDFFALDSETKRQVLDLYFSYISSELQSAHMCYSIGDMDNSKEIIKEAREYLDSLLELKLPLTPYDLLHHLERETTQLELLLKDYSFSKSYELNEMRRIIARADPEEIGPFVASLSTDFALEKGIDGLVRLGIHQPALEIYILHAEQELLRANDAYFLREYIQAYSVLTNLDSCFKYISLLKNKVPGYESNYLKLVSNRDYLLNETVKDFIGALKNSVNEEINDGLLDNSKDLEFVRRLSESYHITLPNSFDVLEKEAYTLLYNDALQRIRQAIENSEIISGANWLYMAFVYRRQSGIEEYKDEKIAKQILDDLE